ncbi:MAG: hypothetical protein WDO18_16270 [Acidobacteriota bacterium]
MKRALLFFSLSLALFAQTDKARIVGTVVDTAGAVVPNVQYQGRRFEKRRRA